MKKGMTLFFIGLVMFMLGIYLSTQWAGIGTLIGIVGGFIMGSSTYFLAIKKA
ncbi:hypothetical protein NGI46_28480 [Peribacillus butanolivorans]|uniref:hypothetical protein n=1 Tax=Peribacillus TaxID=2675229 RepID=UPI00207CC825|nr:hypothetical protein [Peribacillus butanolivorans]MCD1162888.1 hypothetical protein [Peribacillus castrilensis]MCO0601234.1 hypothetical protein [Peribacillus butanolivorans]